MLELSHLTDSVFEDHMLKLHAILANVANTVAWEIGVINLLVDNYVEMVLTSLLGHLPACRFLACLHAGAGGQLKGANVKASANMM